MRYKFCPKCGSEYKKQEVQKRFVCASCDFIFYVNSAPTASTLIVKDNRVLLGKRRIKPSKNKWDVIGGFLELGEPPEAGAIREAKEETGLDVKIGKLAGIFMDNYAKPGDKTLNICYTAEIVGGQETPGDDIKELRWFSPGELPKDMAFRCNQEMLDAWLASIKK